MTARRLIAISGYRTSGKSEIARILVEQHGFVRVRFAGPLKNMLRAVGLGDRELDGDLKDKPCDLLQGKTPVQAMQTLGTEWGRQMIGPNFWVDLWHESVASALAGGNPVVVDDLRFPTTELSALLGRNAWLWRVWRPRVDKPEAHISESGIDRLPFHRLVHNDGTKEVLAVKVGALLDAAADSHDDALQYLARDGAGRPFASAVEDRGIYRGLVE